MWLVIIILNSPSSQSQLCHGLQLYLELSRVCERLATDVTEKSRSTVNFLCTTNFKDVTGNLRKQETCVILCISRDSLIQIQMF